MKEGTMAKDNKKINEPVTINIADMYKFNPEDLIPDISAVSYSNHTFIQVTERDVYIDFLEMPGVKKDGKMHVNGSRIYMTHAAAQSLCNALGDILKRVSDDGRMETYESKLKSKEILSRDAKNTKQNTEI